MSWLDEEAPVRATPVIPRALPENAAERNEMVEAAWKGLRGKQQQYLQALRFHSFNQAATLRALELSGDSVNRGTIHRWTHEDADFKLVLNAMKAIAREEVVDPDQLLLQANHIAEQALAPKPILHKGEPTGFYEQNLDTALRATELTMKTQKMLGADQEDKVFGGRSIQLVVQVVQGDGTLKDVTPAGVVVDVGTPDWLTDES